jgi:hypothetical protein
MNTETSLSYGIGNPNPGTGLTNIGFTDDLPLGLQADNTAVDNGCGGTLSVNFNLTAVTLSGGSLGAGEICAISLSAIDNTWSGLKTNSVRVGSSAGFGNTATATITVLQPSPSNRVYWGGFTAGAPTISFEDLFGGPGGDLPTPNATVNDPEGVALDLRAGRIYWANGTPKKLSYANLDGSGGADLTISGVTVNGASGIAVDPAAGRIYWGNGGAISYANLDGSGAHDLNTAGATKDSPSGLAIDAAAGRIYWANRSSNKISYANLNGSGGGDLSTGFVNGPTGVAVDTGAAIPQIYWVNTNDNTVTEANLDGSAAHTISTNGATLNAPFGAAIDRATQRIFWGNAGAQSISSADLFGAGLGIDQTTPSVSNMFPVLLKAPVVSGTPAITGGTTPGSVLTCSGGFAPDLLPEHLYRAPESIAYQWQLNGAAIPSATSSTLTAAATGSYTCTETASNPAGTAGPQTSAPFSVAQPPASSPTGRRAAALKKCKKIKNRVKRRKCKKRARRLPV